MTKSFGFPVGAATLADEVGIDVGAHIAVDLAKAFGDRFSGGDLHVMQDMVRAGFMGRKSGKGIYVYDKTNSKSRELNEVRIRHPSITSERMMEIYFLRELWRS